MNSHDDNLIAELSAENSRLWKLIAELMLKNEQLRQSLKTMQYVPGDPHIDDAVNTA